MADQSQKSSLTYVERCCYFVIQLNNLFKFTDGYAYSKGKMEDALRSVFAKPSTKTTKEVYNGKKDDVDLIVCARPYSGRYCIHS